MRKNHSSNGFRSFNLLRNTPDMPRLLICLFACLVLTATAQFTTAQPLVWESTELTNFVSETNVTAHFTFKVRNVSTNEVVIDDVQPSCGCTAAKIPMKPWRLGPNESSQFEAVVDLRGKTGILEKEIEVISATAPTNLFLTVVLPDGTNSLSMDEQDRIWGQELAATDHQAVFKEDCVRCHLVPAFGKKGADLYDVACGICHESPRRATMVPDLRALKTEIDANYWRNWVTNGKTGTLMPGFDAREGGPLSDAQIDSLVAFLSTNFPRPLKSATSVAPKPN